MGSGDGGGVATEELIRRWVAGVLGGRSSGT